MYNFTTSRLGEYAMLIQVAQKPSQDLLQWLVCKKEQLQSLPTVEVVFTYNEILVKFLLPLEGRYDTIRASVEEILKSSIESIGVNGVLHKVPVCYNSQVAPDLEEYASQVNLRVDQVVALHTSPVYPVYFIGFLPGFPYLDGLDSKLHLERKATPSQFIQPGSVAIGGAQTGIYPQRSPGGWHVIGSTPVQLFDINKNPQSLFKAGDSIKFYAITLEEYKVYER
ncbi:5-oxoprolinase subunit PxpB [Dokdonia sp. LLG6352-1]|uniref:5-oxoprolinase subunit PxpB n=1 Tax=Dokdonia sp. LLG6352-1 TaxID=3160831 RepID=UPI00386EE9C9